MHNLKFQQTCEDISLAQCDILLNKDTQHTFSTKPKLNFKWSRSDYCFIHRLGKRNLVLLTISPGFRHVSCRVTETVFFPVAPHWTSTLHVAIHDVNLIFALSVTIIFCCVDCTALPLTRFGGVGLKHNS